MTPDPYRIGKTFSRSSAGRAITWTPISSPTRRAAAAPASVAAFTEPDVAANEGRDQAGIHLLPAHEHDVRGLEHRVGRFDHADQPPRLDHAQRVTDVRFVLRHGRDLTTPSCAAVQ